MQRRVHQPRDNWQEIVESQGLSFYLTDDRPYWNESACYVFTADEIDALETATYALDKMCLQAVEYVIKNNLFEQFQIPAPFIPLIKSSWETDEQTIYGRFDFAFDGSTPKLLEYNADTPTGLIEAAVIQWFWLKDVFSGDEFDQFNSIHERLIEAWKSVKTRPGDSLYFCAMEDVPEDFLTANYLRDTAMQAGHDTQFIGIENIGWNERDHVFTDLDEKPINTIFKLYPWEWLAREEFGKHLAANTARWLEPPWKMLLSNKAILPLLHQLFPNSPYILPAAFEPIGNSYIQKPILGREGANMRLIIDEKIIQETDGPYDGDCVYQEYSALPDFDGNFPVIGSWMVNGYACGIGIREESARITTNQSRFVPHYFETRK